MAKKSGSHGWSVGVQVRMNRRGQAVLGAGQAELLEAIGELRSITAAAKAVGISYRKAWMVVQEVNRGAGEPLVASAVGGLRGGGAELTEQGRDAVEAYRRIDKAMHRFAGRALESVGSRSQVECVHVAAAISLQEAMGQILAGFALVHPEVRVRVVYGASNELADQLLAGAPGSLFVSAEGEQVDALEHGGIVDVTSRRVIAFNGLSVICSEHGERISCVDDLAGSSVKRVAMAEPDCPLGRYSQRYLQSAGVYERVAAKAVHVDNSRGVLAAVASGAADTGVAFASDAARAEGCRIAFRVPRSKAHAVYEAALIADGPAPEGAQRLLAYLTSPTGAKGLRRCGFQVSASVRRRARAR
jgi:molybdenum ABC transporter molybdate-binding protein